MAECFFCGRDEKLTRAHLFQDRFRQAIGSGEGTVRLGASSYTTDGVYRDLIFPGDIRLTKVTSLCKECNGRWMNQIEMAAAPVFESIMRGEGFPPPGQLMKLAHWATVVGALSSELIPSITIPIERRREIRFTRTGQPSYYSTFFIWTCDYLDSLQTDLFRVAGGDDQNESAVAVVPHPARWPAGRYLASPDLFGRVAAVLEERHVRAALGAFSSNIVYVPQGFAEAAKTGAELPSHQQVHESRPVMLGTNLRYAETPNGIDLLDLSGGLKVSDVDFSYNFEGLLIDVRSQLELDYMTWMG